MDSPRGPATLVDVASRAGVSAATASRVLSSSRPVGQDIARRVRLAADELGYRGNGVARALRTQRTDSVGMVVPTILNPFFASLVDAMAGALDGLGRQLLLCDARQDPAVEARHLRSLVERHVDGIVVSACDDRASLPTVAAAAAQVPLVQLDRRLELPGTDWVGLDDDAALGLAVAHLERAGARRVAFVTSAMTNSSTADRLGGFRRHVAATGMQTRPDWVVLGDYSVATGESAAVRLLSGPPGADRPDAVVCADDLIAVGVLRGCRALGVAVPHEVQVTGLDDIEFGGYVDPPLTTLAQPTDRMATEVVRLLDRRRDAGAADGADTGATRLALAPRLVLRGSTRPEENP